MMLTSVRPTARISGQSSEAVPTSSGIPLLLRWSSRWRAFEASSRGCRVHLGQGRATAVHGQSLSGDEGGFLREEEQGGVGGLPGRPSPPERDRDLLSSGHRAVTMTTDARVDHPSITMFA